jgi:ribosomal protein S19
MSRSLKKGPFVANHLLKKVQKLNDQDDKSYPNLVTII